MNNICKLVLAAGLACAAASGATAATFTFLQSGTFTSDSGGGFANSDIALGDTFEVAAVYDSTATPYSSFTNAAFYTPTKITLSVSGEILSFENQARLLVKNNAQNFTFPAAVFDELQVVVSTGGFTFAGATWTIGVARSYFAPNQFTSTDLPDTLPTAFPMSVPGLDSSFLLWNDTPTGPISVTGLIDQVSIVAGDASPVMSPVPLPAGGLLLLSGIVGFITLKRRKRGTSI